MIHDVHCKMKCNWSFDVQTLRNSIVFEETDYGMEREGRRNLSVENN